MKKMKFVKFAISVIAVFLTGCGDTEKLAALEDRDYAYKVLFDDISTSGCWLRYRVSIDGQLDEKPWSAFLLNDEGRYFQSAYKDGNISVDTSRAYWHQDVRDLIWVLSYKEEVSVRIDIKILGFYSSSSHSFNTYTTVTDTNYTTKKQKKSDFHDVIVKDENFESILGETKLHPLCDAIQKESAKK